MNGPISFATIYEEYMQGTYKSFFGSVGRYKKSYDDVEIDYLIAYNDIPEDLWEYFDG